MNPLTVNIYEYKMISEVNEMKELNISKCINQKRKEKGITQEQLADYIGVSKASVSKWESGQSYPDILLLPEIATYFNITVDELIGYSPQLTKEDIKKIYKKFCKDFASKPFDVVMDEYEQMTKEYYSCFPFLLTMVQLLLNHYTLTDTEENKKALLQKCVLLCQHIKDGSDVVNEISQANSLEAVAEMFDSNFTGVIDLLDSTIVPSSGEDELLIQAYMSVGDSKNATIICQVNLFQKVISILSLLSINASMHMSDPVMFETIYQQGRQIIKSFDLKNIVCNSVAVIHLVAAQGYIMQQDNKKALDALAEYVDTVCGFTYPLKIRGNLYFNYIDEWIEENIPLGSIISRDENAVKKSFIDALDNPIYESIKGDEKYKLLMSRLEQSMKN